MKNLILLLFIMYMPLYTFAENITLLQFSEQFSTSYNPEYHNTPISQKSKRISSNAGNINAIYNETIPDSIQTCIEAAIDIWESKIGTTVPIRFEFRYENIGANDILTSVYYTEYHDTYITTALKATLNNESDRDTTYPDAIIQINNTIEWDCSFNENQLIGMNSLPMGLLRAISRALGFGSSIKKDKRGNFTFGQQNQQTDFDCLIFSSTGEWLKDQSQENLPDFVAPDSGEEIFVLKQSAPYKMYAPAEYEDYKSLLYLDNTESLMHYDIGAGNRYLRIDDTTSEILSALGWDVYNTSTIKIIGTGIDSTGITSAYEPHQFTITQNTSGTVSNAQWEYRLPLKNGSETIIKTARNTLNFEIPAIDDESKYETNINGDIYGRIIFTGTLNGREGRAIGHVSISENPFLKRPTC